jgi:hypothetical protein
VDGSYLPRTTQNQDERLNLNGFDSWGAEVTQFYGQELKLDKDNSCGKNGVPFIYKVNTLVIRGITTIIASCYK